MSDESFMSRLRGKRPPELSERRRALRTATVFQVAKLVSARHEELCILRDVSPTGLKAEIYCSVPIGERIEIELKTEHRVAGEVVWARDGMIGMQFDIEVPVLAMLAHCAFDDRIARIRPPRIACALAATLATNDETYPMTVRNVSLAGMKIALDTLPAEGNVTAIVPELGRRACAIRWMRNGEAGVLFDEPLLYEEFVDWRRRLLRLEPSLAA